MARIEFDRSKCIGCESCCFLNPETWKMGDDFKAIPNSLTEFDQFKTEEAARYCPVKAFKVVEK
ncbi:MAG: ferredoxin [Candidatus Micrarchaeota archaeon]|nr:ferredoxin [Candidatus Micrarchaeota archaeon]